MRLEDQAALVGLLPVVPTALFVIGGVWAIWLVRRRPRIDRPDHRAALRLGGALALVAAGGVIYFAAALGTAFGGSATAGIAAGVPIAIGIAALAFLSSLAGYALLARPSVGASALVGVIAGPVVLAGATWLAMPVAGDAQRTLERRAIEERSGFIHVGVEDVQYAMGMTQDKATGRDVQVVTSVHLTVDIRIDAEQDLQAYGILNLYPSGPIVDALVYQDYVRSTTLLAGRPNRFDLSFGFDPPVLDARQRPGQWTLGLILHVGKEETEYRTEQTITVGPG